MATASSGVCIPLRKTFVFLAPDNDLVQPIEPVIGLVDTVYEIDMNGVDSLIRLVDTTALVSEVNVDVVQPLVGELQGGE